MSSAPGPRCSDCHLLLKCEMRGFLVGAGKHHLLPQLLTTHSTHTHRCVECSSPPADALMQELCRLDCACRNSPPEEAPPVHIKTTDFHALSSLMRDFGSVALIL